MLFVAGAYHFLVLMDDVPDLLLFVAFSRSRSSISKCIRKCVRRGALHRIVLHQINYVCISEIRAGCGDYTNLFVHLVRFARSTCLWLIAMFVRNAVDSGVGLHGRCFNAICSDLQIMKVILS